MKEFEIAQKSRSKIEFPKIKNVKKDKLPLYIIGGLLCCLVAVGIIWFSSSSLGGSLFGSRATATDTIDPVQSTLAAIQQTAQAEQIFLLSATPTMTPVPTHTETAIVTVAFIDFDTVKASPADFTEASVLLEPTSTVIAPTAVPEEKKPIVSEIDQSEMMYVKSGDFLLGTNDVYAAGSEEGPQVEVYLDAFWMDKTEVTNRQYLMCVEAGTCEESPYMTLRNSDYADFPVTYVSWENAKTYCEWAGKRLPTEIEWEKAARGSDGRIYPWGEEEPTLENKLANIPYYSDSEKNLPPGLFKTGSFPDGASPYGILDLAGNVWEWTSSYYDAGYYQMLSEKITEEGDVVDNPAGAETGSAYVIRGGSAAETEVNNYLSYTRSTYRGYVNMSSSYYIGFRCVMPDSEE
jgi:formylglycine-generating enzyme required for sulfatase activity